MDLLDLMSGGDDLREKALDRLEGIVALYHSDHDDVQDEALARAISLCGKEWGGYRDGIEALALRTEQRSPDSSDVPILREEAENPGEIIRSARESRQIAQRKNAERDAIAARYGSIQAALAPNSMERLFVDSAQDLADDGDLDPWTALAGWQVPWHDLPPALVQAITDCRPLPETLVQARAETLMWDERLRERTLLQDGEGRAVLPTACSARHRLVMDLWRKDLPVRDGADLEARLSYWSERADGDSTGYAIILAGFRALMESGVLGQGGESTKGKARRLRQDHPEWSLARIGAELGISRQAVHKHLKA